jgi:hypothetical protein
MDWSPGSSMLAIVHTGLLLSEPVFLFILAASLLLLIRGLRAGSVWCFPWSGLLLAGAILTRSFGLFLPVVYLALGVVYAWPLSRARWPVIRRQLFGVLIATVIPVIICSAWVLHNQRIHRVSQFALATPAGLVRTARLAMSKFDGMTMEQADSVISEDMRRHPLYDQNRGQAFVEVSFAEFEKQLSARPGPLLWLLASNAWSNMTTETSSWWVPPRPSWINKQINAVSRIPYVQYRGILFMFLGAVVFWWTKQYRVLIVLLLFCAYFGAAGTFAWFQGARIFFPAQLTGLTLVAAVWVKAFDWYTAKLRTRMQPGELNA